MAVSLKVATFVAFLHQLGNRSANIVQGLLDVADVASLQLNHLDTISDDMILADFLIPKRLDADRASANFRVPNKEARGKILAADFHPSVGVDAKGEHILFTGIESGSSAQTRGRGREIGGGLADRFENFRVKQTRVRRAVHRQGGVGCGASPAIRRGRQIE